MDKKIADSIEPFIIILIPCLLYMYFVVHYAVNVPYWDDFSVVLYPAVEAAASGKWGLETYWFRTNAGHVPLLTHAVAWVQFTFLGGINFKWSTVAGNVGMLLSVVVFVSYFVRQLNLPLRSAIPIPFLLLSLIHWESMHFMVPAWQFYWGACLFPLLVFIAAVARQWCYAAMAFAAALFLSSGALAIFPLVIVYYLLKKYWREALGFGLLAGLSLLLHSYFLPPRSVATGVPDITTTFVYVSAFMGSVISTPSGDLHPYAAFHSVIGVAVLLAASWLIWKSKSGDVLKLVIIYVICLSIMAVALRAYAGLLEVPSRYTTFALMALVCVYGLSLTCMENTSIVFNRSVLLVSVLSMLLWTYNIYACRKPLDLRNHSLVLLAHQYNAGNRKKALSTLLWDAELGEKILDDARKFGIYDFRVAEAR